MTEQEEVNSAVHYASLGGYGRTLNAYHHKLIARIEELSSPEVCLCAAIKMPDGEVVRGHRHNNCYDVVRCRENNDGGANHINICRAEQGFLTSRGRFVDRCEGMSLMRASGLPSHYHRDGAYVGDELFSEDLYPNGPMIS